MMVASAEPPARMFRYLATLLYVLPVIAAAAQMLELRGLRPGMTKAAIHQRMPQLKCAPGLVVRAQSTCSYVSTNPHQESISDLNSLDGVAVDAWELRFDQDVLGRIVVSFHPADFGTLIRALRREFGDPTSESAQTLYDRAGTPVRSREIVWRRNSVTMVATEFAGRLGQSTLSLTSDAHLQQPRR